MVWPWLRKYCFSCGPRAGGYRPLRELAEVVRLLRERHAEWRVDPERIAVLGFSAGGHLAASLGALWNDAELALPAASRPSGRSSTSGTG